MEHMHRPSAAHDNIANTGDDEHIDALPYAVLQDNVSFMAVNTTDKNSLHAVQNAQVCQALRHAQGDLHIVFLTQAVLVDELFHAMSHIVDHSGLLRRKGRIVPFMCAGCPDRSHHQLPHNCRNTRQQIAELCRHQADHDVQNTIGCHSAKDLAVHQLRDPLHGHPERIVDLTQCNVQDKKQT